MNAPTHPAVRTHPNPEFTTATRAPVAPELVALDRQFGSLPINGWTYRVFRLLSRFVTPKVDLSGVTVTELRDAGPGMFMVRPDEVRVPGALLFIHGGGYVVGSPNDAFGKAALLARAIGVTVYANRYRLGPQHPFPAPIDDCVAAWRWLLEHAESQGIDPAKIIVGGASAGGGHAAATVQRIHDEGGPQPAAQLLVYPMLDDRTAIRDDLDGPSHRVWSNANNLFGWSSHLGHAPGEASPSYAVPARREDLSGLPPAWIGVGTPDLFLDEDRDYAQRLRDAGVDVSYVEVDGGIHGFDAFGAELPISKAFDAHIVDFVKRFVS